MPCRKRGALNALFHSLETYEVHNADLRQQILTGFPVSLLKLTVALHRNRPYRHTIPILSEKLLFLLL
ncbi:MAG: hypothetical protein V3G42_07545 [Oscillospiraceae bacterium]